MWLHVPARNQIFVRNLEFVGRKMEGGHIHRFMSNLEFVGRTVGVGIYSQVCHLLQCFSFLKRWRRSPPGLW